MSADHLQRFTTAAALAGCLIGCATPDDQGGEGSPRPAPPTVEYSKIEPIITTSSALLGYPSDLAVAPDGTLWIADWLGNCLLTVQPDGSDPQAYGREGEGPGEFRAPVAIAITDSIVRVLEATGNRVQDLGLDGRSVATYPLPRSVQGPVAIAPDFRVGLPMQGYQNALLLIFEPRSGSPHVILGPAVTQAPVIWDFTAMRAEIRKGTMPGTFRNHILPTPGVAASWFLLLQTEGQLRKYSRSGELQWSANLDFPELEAARAEFFRRNNEEPDPAKLTAPVLIADARTVGHELWVMPKPTPFAPVTIYALDQDTGLPLHRLVITTPHSPTRFAVDEQRSRLYLVFGESAAVMAVDLATR